MRDQIRTGLELALTYDYIEGQFDIDVERVIDVIVEQLASAPATASAPIDVVLPEATPVTVMDAPTMVAFIASNAAADAPVDEQATTREFAGEYDYRQTRHLMWALQAVFGVRVNTNRQSGTVRIGGRPSDVSAFRLVTNALIASGRPEAERLVTDEERNTFWTTLGQLVATSDRAVEQAADAADRTDAATQALADVYGLPRTVNRAAVAENGTPLYEAVTRTLAATALDGS